MENSSKKCPHCHQDLSLWESGPFSDWSDDLLYCENNECGYFKNGRRKICDEFDKNFAYRYGLNPQNGKEIPLMAWCPGELSLLKGKCSEV